MPRIVKVLSQFRKPNSRNRLTGTPGVLVSMLAVCWSLFHLYTGYYPLIGMYQRIVFAAFGMVIIFCILPLSSNKSDPTRLTIPAIVAALAVVGILIYLAVNYTLRPETLGYDIRMSDLVLGGIFIVLVLETCRRTTGLPFMIIAVLLVIYARFGEFLPDLLAHRNYDVERIISGLFLTTEGMFGAITGIAATFVYIFILFGAFLRNTGAGDFFLDLANALLGKRRGGAAKVAVLGSSFFGMVSGSCLANVAGTGQFTIPLMKRTGYAPHFAGGVEAVASAGGQLLPPIMGGTAFIMMEVLGISYLAVCKAALIIGILYYVDVFFMVDIEAARTGLVGLKPGEVPPLKRTLMKGWHFIVPVIVLVFLLVQGASATRAAFWGTVSIPLISLFRREGRIGLKQIIWALEDAAYTSCAIVGIVMAMGVVVGMITLTGLGLMLSTILLELSGGHLFALLVLAMVASIILGMGVPIICAYIVLAVLVCPALIQLGVAPIAAHLFVFYFAIISAITPPVAPDAFVAAGIAEAPMMKTAISACKTGLALVILPYIMVYDTALVMQGAFLPIISVILRSVAAILALVAFRQGYLIRSVNWWERIALLIAVGLLAYPGFRANMVGYMLMAIPMINGFIKRQKELNNLNKTEGVSYAS